MTPCKHYLLDKILGSEFGVTSRPQFDNLSAYIVIDLTAGDGVPVTRDGELIPVFNEGCSPGICLKHLDHRAKTTLRATAFLIFGKQHQSRHSWR